MLVPIERLLGVPILGLQTGAELARANDVIIDPRQLKIVAMRVNGPLLDHHDSVLHPEDIREISDLGFIIDSSDKLMTTDGLVRLQQVIDFGFTLNGTRVEDDQGRKVGSVKSYAVDPSSFFVEQLYLKPPLMRSIGITTLTIHRSQIISITNEKIVVKSPTVQEQVKPAEKVQPAFVNPFRAPAPPLEGRQD
jgi:uncharacterized protein YrrD